jgi:hypothetical protein
MDADGVTDSLGIAKTGDPVPAGAIDASDGRKPKYSSEATKGAGTVEALLDEVAARVSTGEMLCASDMMEC